MAPPAHPGGARQRQPLATRRRQTGASVIIGCFPLRRSDRATAGRRRRATAAGHLPAQASRRRWPHRAAPGLQLHGIPGIAPHARRALPARDRDAAERLHVGRRRQSPLGADRRHSRAEWRAPRRPRPPHRRPGGAGRCPPRTAEAGARRRLAAPLPHAARQRREPERDAPPDHRHPPRRRRVPRGARAASLRRGRPAFPDGRDRTAGRRALSDPSPFWWATVVCDGSPADTTRRRSPASGAAGAPRIVSSIARSRGSVRSAAKAGWASITRRNSTQRGSS